MARKPKRKTEWMEVDLSSDSCPVRGKENESVSEVPFKGQERKEGRTVDEGPHATPFSLTRVDGVDKVLSDSVH